MRLVRFSHAGRVGHALMEDEGLFEIGPEEFFGPSGGGGRPSPKGPPIEPSSVRLLAPVLPTKIVAVGLNYRAHAAEFDQELPDEPLIFLKPSTSVIGPGDEIVYPAGLSHRVDYEGELGVVMGRRARDIGPGEAGRYILGYTAFNDVTARDLQGRDGQWTRAKGFDTFAPMGPWIETDLDPGGLSIETRLNGEVRQRANTAEMIFPVAELVSFVSRVMTLLPGDVIATGTPPGVGKMRPGDRVEVRVEGIGALVNGVVLKEAARGRSD